MARQVIEGLEKAQIGAGQMENSVMACLHYFFQTIGENYDYSYLMGISGCAFRIQYHFPEPCPSSPHACVGFSCEEEMWKHLPYKVEYVKADREDPAWPKVVDRIMANIDKGWPVLLVSEENGLVVGYDDEKGLICRPYATEEGYYPVGDEEGWNKWPWAFGFIERDETFAERQTEILRRSLVLIKELWEMPAIAAPTSPEIHSYALGKAAYEKWIEQLGDNTIWETGDGQKDFMNQLANGHTYYSLLDARGSAEEFFRMKPDHPGDEGMDEMIKEIAGMYAEIVSILSRECPTKIAPMPWMEGEWSEEQRHRQRQILEDVFAVEKRIIETLDISIL